MSIFFLYVLVCVYYVHAPGRACVFLVSSCIMHMRVWVPCNFYQRDLLLTGRAKVSSWPSHHALSVGCQECAGMWARTGGGVLLRDRHPDTTPNPPLHPLSLPQPVFPPPPYTLPVPPLSSFPSLCVCKTNVRKPLSSFLSAHGEQMRKGGRQNGEKRLI